MDRKTQAYVVPFAVFLLFLAVPGVVAPWFGGFSTFLGENPKLIVWPVQTFVCAALVLFYWREYEWGTRFEPLPAVGIGVLCLVLWLVPGYLRPGEPRVEGFNPNVLLHDPLLWWLTIVARFVRLVIIVPIVEEIFWRGFLMRYLVNPEFEKVRFGTYTPLSFWVVAVLFALEHQQADWIGGVLAGILFGFVAVKTRSLTACIIAHAVTNLLLGLYVMGTQRWGYW